MERSPSLGPWELPDYHGDKFTLRQMGKTTGVREERVGGEGAQESWDGGRDQASWEKRD